MSSLNFKILQEMKANFPSYAYRNLKITDKSGNLVPLKLNRMQKTLWLIILELVRLGKPVRIYLIKARQLGSTTFFSAVLYWLSTLNKNKRVIAIAQDDEAAENVNLRWQNYYWNSIPQLRPRFRKMNPKLIHFALPIKELKKASIESGLDSILVAKTADSPQLGRSYTYNGALLTEFCIWPQLGIDVKSRMVALSQAVPRKSNTAVFIESTAQGDNYGRKFWDDKENGYTKVFVSWLADDEYRFKLSLNRYFELHQSNEERYGNEVLERHNVIAQLKIWYPLSEFGKADFPDEHLFTSYDKWINHESYCRLKWRRQTIDIECQGDKDSFKQEYPTTVHDAFGVSSKSVFGAIKLLQAKEFIKNNSHVPEMAAKKFTYSHPQSVKKATVKEVLSKFSKGRLRIYELPKADARYVCGSDAAQGTPGGDDSSFVIFKLSPETGKLIEVCSYNDNIEATEYAGLLHIICTWYNTALLAVERNEKAGFAVLEILLKHHRYPKLYWYKDPLSRKSPNQVTFGWRTNEMTRQIMIKDGITWFQKDYFLIRSPEIIEQMDTFCENQKTGKIEATAGNKDDLVMAMLISSQLSKQIHIREPNVEEKIPQYSMAWWSGMADRKRGKYVREFKSRKPGRRKPVRA